MPLFYKIASKGFEIYTEEILLQLANTDVLNFNSHFSNYLGNGITGEKANSLVKLINRCILEENDISLYIINSKGEYELICDKTNINDGINFSNNYNYYITMEKNEEGFINKIYIQQGQKEKTNNYMNSSNDILERTNKVKENNIILNEEETITIGIGEIMSSKNLDLDLRGKDLKITKEDLEEQFFEMEIEENNDGTFSILFLETGNKYIIDNKGRFIK